MFKRTKPTRRSTNFSVFYKGKANTKDNFSTLQKKKQIQDKRQNKWDQKKSNTEQNKTAELMEYEMNKRMEQKTEDTCGPTAEKANE